jgi:serine/threonine protein kinase
MSNNIRIYCNEFKINNITYKLKNLHVFNNGSTGEVKLCNLTSSNNKSIKVIVKKFDDKNDYVYEKMKIRKIMDIFENYSFDFYHKILYYDNLNNILIYEYLGKTLIDYDVTKLSFEQKIHLFKNLIEICIVFNDLDIIHNDIKPCNVVINDNLAKAMFVDFGISQFITEDFQNKTKFDTTLWSASPEYYLINKIINEDIWMLTDDIIDMYKKSQMFPLAGILIGLLINNVEFYFKTLYCFVKFDEENDVDMITRFENFNYNKNFNVSRALNIILHETKNYFLDNKIDLCVYDLICKMLELDYEKRITYDQMLIELENIITNNNEKIDQITI